MVDMRIRDFLVEIKNRVALLRRESDSALERANELSLLRSSLESVLDRIDKEAQDLINEAIDESSVCGCESNQGCSSCPPTKDPIIETPMGETDIVSNGKEECLRCGVAIIEENQSGWEMFATASTTQVVCKECHKELSKEIAKAEEE